MESQVHNRREETLRRNLKTAYAIILDEFTSKIVQERVRAIPDLHQFVGDPIELLIRIRGQMEDTGVAQYSMISDQRTDGQVQQHHPRILGIAHRLRAAIQTDQRRAQTHEVDMSIPDCFAVKHKEYKALTE